MSEEREGGTTVFQEQVGVLIVGAGPTGLTLAAQLHALGASIRIVDRQLDRVHESRALAVQPRTLELLRALGVSEQLVERGNDAVQLRLHFGERVVPIRLFDVGLEDTAYPFLLFVSQAETEAVLNEHLAERGIEVERGVELVAFTAGEQHVTCTLRHRNGSTEEVRARYLVGCDGAHSSVRQGAGIPFEGGRYGPGVRLATRPSLTISDKRPSLSFKWASASIAASRSGAGGSHARARRGRGGRNGGRSSELMPASVRRPA